MKIKVRFSTKFRKQYQKSPLKIRNAFEFRLKLFLDNSDNPILNNHQLTGNFKGYSSINVNGDWRALFTIENIGNIKIITFEFLGTHSQLYG